MPDTDLCRRPCSYVDLDNAPEQGDGDRLGPVRCTELADGGLDVLVDRSLGDMENFPDLPGRLASRRPCQDLHLARRERMGRRRRLGGSDFFPKAISPQARKEVRVCT